jgi:hypothetical protein
VGSHSTGYLSIRTLDPLVVTPGFIVAAKLLIKNGKLDGEVELRTAELGTEITLIFRISNGSNKISNGKS